MTTHRTALLLVSLLLLASPAAAASAQDQAAAETLFNAAKKLSDAGDFEQACPKFVESQRLDPTAGTLLNIGRCYEKSGKMASAWGAYKEAEMVAKNAGDRDREAGAARLAAAVAPLLPKLAIVISPATRIPGLEVRRDGTLVGEGQSGMLLPADVGYHTVDATAPGYEPWSTTVRIDAAGSAATVEVPPLKKLPAESTPVKPGFTWSTQRSIGVVLGVVALVGFGVAVGFTVNAATKNAASLPHCPTSPNQCDATGVDLRNQAFDAAHVGTGTLIGGAAAATAGLIVFLTASNGTPKKTEASTSRVEVHPMAGPGFATLSIKGVL